VVLGVLALKLDRLVMNHGGPAVYLRLGSMFPRPRGIVLSGRLALGLALVRPGSSLALLRSLLPRPGPRT
jgi:hypothetical protein